MFGDKDLSNEELVRQCMKGNQQAYRQLYDQYAPQMMGVCMRYAHSKAVAEDLLHDGFLKVFGSLDRLKDPQMLSAWIKRIMVNEAINYVNRKMRRFDDLNEMDDTLMTDYQADYDHLDVEYLLEVIQNLPDKYRLVFNMKEIEGYQFEEIARKMNIEQSSVRSILSRARSMIKEKIEKDER